MLRLTFLFAFVSLLCWVNNISVSSASIKDERLIQLTPENFEETLRKNSNLLVVYTTPWCGYCKSLLPDLLRVVTRLKYKKIDVS